MRLVYSTLSCVQSVQHGEVIPGLSTETGSIKGYPIWQFDRVKQQDQEMTEYRLAETPYNPYEPDNVNSWNKVLRLYSYVGFKPLSFEILAAEVNDHPHPGGGEGFIKWHISMGRLIEV